MVSVTKHQKTLLGLLVLIVIVLVAVYIGYGMCSNDWGLSKFFTKVQKYTKMPFPEWLNETPSDNVLPALNYNNKECSHNKKLQDPNQFEGFASNAGVSEMPTLAPTDNASNLIFKDGNVPRDYVVDDEVAEPTVLKSGDLLPTDDNNAWADVNPEGTGSLAYKNFLEAGHHIGQLSLLRNAQQDLRAEYTNPQLDVGPWMQTTIVPNPHYNNEGGEIMA